MPSSHDLNNRGSREMKRITTSASFAHHLEWVKIPIYDDVLCELPHSPVEDTAIPSWRENVHSVRPA